MINSLESEELNAITPLKDELELSIPLTDLSAKLTIV